MQFSSDKIPLYMAGASKGIEIVLRERNLWPQNRKLPLSCRTEKKNCTGIACCARTLLGSQPDFQEQKCRVQEAIEAQGHLCLFLPKFHPELSRIEYFWSYSKKYAWLNCGYSLHALHKIIPKALDAVPPALIHKYWLKTLHIMDAYRDGYKLGTREFTDHVFKQHRGVQL